MKKEIKYKGLRYIKAVSGPGFYHIPIYHAWVIIPAESLAGASQVAKALIKDGIKRKRPVLLPMNKVTTGMRQLLEPETDYEEEDKRPRRRPR